MALVTKIGNLINKNKDKPEVKEFVDTLPNLDQWN
jgi:hypothetical protein